MAKPPREWTVLSMLKWATSYFEERKIKSPRFSIEWLLAHLLEVKRLDLYLMYDRPLTSDILKQLRLLVKRRAAHEPLQYITGETDFLNTTIKVEPGVLIPRMETEQLVEIILNAHSEGDNFSILDIGTGSGCIPIALKKNRPSWNVYATDISEEALLIAKKNSIYNDVHITFLKDDVFSTLLPSDRKYDLIVSNPPYILKEEQSLLDKEVVNYEPELALFCKSTDSIYGAIKKLSSQFLTKNGFLFLELHEDHAHEVHTLFSTNEWESYLHKDYDDKDRFLVAKKMN